jgi:hypothetical protein
VREFLRAKDMLDSEAVDPLEGTTAPLQPPELLETAQEFQQAQGSYADLDRDVVALMLCCFAACAPLPDVEEPPKQMEAIVRWELWLAELRTLPADAPEWETVTEFIESVQRLGEEKCREREESREQLRDALASLKNQAVADLEYFGLHVTSWTAEVCPFAEAMALAEQVTQFHEALSTHRHLRQQRGATLTEDRSLRDERDRLEELVLQTHARLSTALTISPPESPAPQTRASETPVPHVEEATPQQEGISHKEDQGALTPLTSSLSLSSEPPRDKTSGMPASEPTTDLPPPEVVVSLLEQATTKEQHHEDMTPLALSSSPVPAPTRVETPSALAAPAPAAEMPPEDATGMPPRAKTVSGEEGTVLSETLEDQDVPLVPQKLPSSQEVATLL